MTGRCEHSNDQGSIKAAEITLDESKNITALLVGRSRDRFPVVSLGIFSVVPPTKPCALRSTQPLKVSTRDFSWGKGGRCFWLTTYHPCSAETSRKSGDLNLPGTPWAISACRGRPLLSFIHYSNLNSNFSAYK